MEDYLMSITIDLGTFRYIKGGRKVQVRQFAEQGSVETRDGVLNAAKGDYLIFPNNGNGNPYPLQPQAFEATFIKR